MQRLIASINTAWWSLVKFGFRLLYNEFAFTYDIVSKVVSLGAWRCWQRSGLNHLPPPDAGVILELAHGTGDMQIDLKARGYKRVGYDLSRQMGRIAWRKLARQGISPDLVRGDAQKLPFRTAQFPAVLSTFPTNFILMETTLAEIHRVLKADGLLVVVSNGALVSGGVLRSFLEWLYRITGQREGQDSHAMAYLHELLDRHGFMLEVVYEHCPRSVATVLIIRKKV